ncbi:unnamed protein product [Meganyctiphanes norvegica]|uniref:Uncharacterized protein n=1 Tax=Meganyctiphanes norvegica TaxID=48144 RepID=A0AAV2PP91_MEGNR
MPPKTKNNDKSKHNEECDTGDRSSDTEMISILRELLVQQEKNFKLIQTTLFNSVKEATGIQISSLEKDVYSLHSRIDALEGKKSELEKKLSNSDTKVAVLENQLGKALEEIDELETYIRRPCLIVNNLSPEHGKTDEDLFVKLCNDKMININMSAEKISKIHRLHRSNNSETDQSKPLALVVKFAKDRYRDEVFKNKKSLKGTRIVISELLTKRRSALLKKCVDKFPGDRTMRSIWTDNGKILVKCGEGRALQVKSENDIDQIIQENFSQALSITDH